MNSRSSSQNSVIILPALAFIIVLIMVACTLGGGGTPTSAIPPTLAPTSIPVSPVNTDGAETVFVPGGAYLIGSTEIDIAALPHEMPQHAVTLTGFNIYTHEVTNAMYQACAQAGACLPVTALRDDLAGYYNNAAYADYPVVGVDWHMANDYCTWANGRLPTEAEWEVAARGDDARIYPWGDTEASCLYAGILGCGKEDLPMAVGLFANGNSPFEAWDMSGNVWEWVNDWYDANYYASSPTADPVGPWSSDYKVVRGGGWNSSPDRARTATRSGVNPALSYLDLGFRCVANGFLVPPDISVTDPVHGHRDGSRSVDDPPGAGTPRTWSWGTPRSDCRPGSIGVISIPAANNFGGTYALTIDGTPMSCSYDAASRWLSCTWPVAAARSGAPGSEYYWVSITLMDASGTPVPGAEYLTGVSSSAFASCSGSSGPTIYASAYCDGRTTPSTPWIIISATAPMRFTRLNFGNSAASVDISDIAGTCSILSPNMMFCPLDVNPTITFAGGTISGQVQGTALDGTSLTASFSSVAVPVCSGGPSSDNPTLNADPFCDESGRSVFRISDNPANSLGIVGVQDAGSLLPVSCRRASDGRLVCDAPRTVVDGQARVTVAAYRRSAPGVPYPLPSLVFTPATCGGSIPGGDTYTYRNPVCRPDGLPGVLARVDYSGPAATVAMQVKYGGMDYPCIPEASAPHSFICSLPVPLPFDLQFCSNEDGGGSNCVASPYNSTHLPARCGGSTPTDRWSISVGCSTSGTGYNAVIGMTGGRNIQQMAVALGSSSMPCTANPAIPNTFTCALPLIVLSTTPEFRATFTDGTTGAHTFADWTTRLPADCPGTGQVTPGGGVCADDPSASAWRNPSNSFDVDNNGCVTALDVLTVINQINSTGGGTLSTPRPAGAAFVDVNGDGRLSAADVLMVINYLNLHRGETCTPACGPGSPSAGDWSLEVVCNPEHVRPGWIELRAHFPGDRSTVTGFGRSYAGCAFGGNPAAGTISQFCEPGTDFSGPMLFWVQRSGGSLAQHTFTNAAELAATCPGLGHEPLFRAETSCNTQTLNTYDVNFSWTPPAYEVYTIYDPEGRVLTNCGTCSGGRCQCTGLTPGVDGLIHVLMDNRTGPTEVMTPLTIAPPSCNGPSNDGWGLTAECNPAAGPNIVTLHFTYPAGLGASPVFIDLASGTIPGMHSCWVGEESRMTCEIDISLAPRGPLTFQFVGSPPDYAPIYHTFTEYDSVVPTSCGGAPGADDITVVVRCSNGHATLSVTAPPAFGLIASLATNPGTPNLTMCSGLGTSLVTCAVPDTLLGTSFTLHIVPFFDPLAPWDTEETVSIPRCSANQPVITPTFTPPPPACSTYDNGLDCGNAGCYWWSAACHADPDPCHKYDGDQTGCEAASCSYDTKNDTCNTP